MASTGQRKTSTKGKQNKGTNSANKRKTTQSAKTNNNGKKQLAAIVLFAVGLLFCALSFIEGQNVWENIRTVVFGIFGVLTYFIGLLLMILAVLYASDRQVGKFRHKVWQITLLFIFICTLIHITTHPEYGILSIGDCLKSIWSHGKVGLGGGLLGGLLGMPMEYAFGKDAAIVVLVIIIFILFFVLTGLTLMGFLKGASKPVQKIEQSVRKRQEDKEKQQFDIDVQLDGMPAHPVAGKQFCVPELEGKKTKPKTKRRTKNKKIDVPLDELNKIPFEPTNIKTENSAKKSEIDELVKLAAKKEAEESKFEAPKIYSKTEENGYIFPSKSLLKAAVSNKNRDISSELRDNADRLVETLRSFGVETRIINISYGPSVTRYELQPSVGVKISKITNLADDIALNLAAGGVRIEAPIPGKAAVGIEVPNKQNEMVSLREIIESDVFASSKSPLTFSLGKDISGKVQVGDIGKMPHMLIAGATGSGKSVCINSLIISLLYKSSPDDVRLLMIDPKVVELGVYNGIPHLLVPVVTDPRKAAGALGWAVTEMLKRYKLFAETGTRDLSGYNKLAANGKTNEEGQPYEHMPHIVIIIDELADLMMAASKEVEDSICRLAQMARAAGMHLVIATQRPSVDVITGVIKANIPSRIAFTVSSQVDSRTILDSGGAEKLLGKGDMLYNPVGAQKPARIQGCFVSDSEVEQVTSFIKSQEEAEYSDKILDEIEKQAVTEKSASQNDGGGFDDQDVMFPAAVEVVIEANQASTSFLQRRLKLGYARAARIMDDMHSKGIVGPQEGSKPREILISKQQWLEMKMNNDESAE